MKAPTRVICLVSLAALAGVLIGASLGQPMIAAAQGPQPQITPTLTPTLTVTPSPVPAETPTITPRPYNGLPVSVEALDERRLVGDLYLINPAGPTVLLQHQLYTDRSSWDGVLGSLLGAGINVLNVDVRGYGATGGGFDWDMAANDVVVWLEWLRSTGWVRSDTTATMGSSMGSSLAILGCARDALCRTAIGISPGWSYQGLEIEPAFTTLLGERPVLLVYAEWDGWPARGVPMMVEAATNPVTVQRYPRNQHGMDLFAWHDDLIGLVIDWLYTNAG